MSTYGTLGKHSLKSLRSDRDSKIPPILPGRKGGEGVWQRNFMTTYLVNCHCHAIKFAIQARIENLSVLNYTIYAKTTYLHIYVNEAKFILLQGNTEHEAYVWGSARTQHHFFDSLPGPALPLKSEACRRLHRPGKPCDL